MANITIMISHPTEVLPFTFITLKKVEMPIGFSDLDLMVRDYLRERGLSEYVTESAELVLQLDSVEEV